MSTVTLTIPGKPYAKKRPRFSRKIGRAFDPAENRVAEASIGAIAAQHFPRPFIGPVKVEVFAWFAMPQSWSRKKRETLACKHHCQKPDGDNIVKAACDALNRIAWADDGQVAEISVTKRWASTDQTIINITALEDQQ